MLAFEPSDACVHAFLQIRKTGENTEYVARQLARFAGVRQPDIGFAGLKDRHAVTTQWFSLWLPGKADPNWAAFATTSIEVLPVIRHARKLQRGALSCNRFTMLVGDWQGDRDKRLSKSSHVLAFAGVSKDGIYTIFYTCGRLAKRLKPKRS